MPAARSSAPATLRLPSGILWICGRTPPTAGIDVPALTRDGYDRGEDEPARLSPRFWRLTAPISSTRLVRSAQRVQAA